MAAERRLIDVNDALQKLCEYCSCGCYEECDYRCSEFDNISNIPTVDAVEVVHGRWKPSKKHIWKMDDGEIDMFAYESGFHNGPVCLCCGAHFCINCEPDWAETECYDIEHCECSACGNQTMTATNYCPKCGAKMDGDGNG